MDERETKAFDFVADLTKQLITLSSGIVTITLLLSKDFIGSRWLAIGAWTCYLLSTVCGLWALMALAGTLAPVKEPKSRKDAKLPAKDADESLEIRENVRTPSLLQILGFGLATVLTLAYVFATFAKPLKVVPAAQNCCCQCPPVAAKP